MPFRNKHLRRDARLSGHPTFFVSIGIIFVVFIVIMTVLLFIAA